MKISKKCEYAIRCLIDISVHNHQTPINVGLISKRQEIPRNFLSSILTDLKKYGFVKSKKGPCGGYYLAQSSTDIILKDVIYTIDGNDLYQINFVSINNKESAYTSQVLKDSLEEIENARKEVMEQLTLRELTTRYKKLSEGYFDYSI